MRNGIPPRSPGAPFVPHFRATAAPPVLVRAARLLLSLPHVEVASIRTRTWADTHSIVAIGTSVLLVAAVLFGFAHRSHGAEGVDDHEVWRRVEVALQRTGHSFVEVESVRDGIVRLGGVSDEVSDPLEVLRIAEEAAGVDRVHLRLDEDAYRDPPPIARALASEAARRGNPSGGRISVLAIDASASLAPTEVDIEALAQRLFAPPTDR